jgi:hypothetical protein
VIYRGIQATIGFVGGEPSPLQAQNDQPKQKLEPDGLTTNRSTAAMWVVGLRRKVRQPGEEGLLRRGMSLATVDWAISIPILARPPLPSDPFEKPSHP